MTGAAGISQSDGVVWRPSASLVDSANITRFMRRHGIKTVAELRQRSLDIEWFWDAVVADLQIAFDEPYTSVLDTSGGAEWPKWFVGGTLNVATACIDRWAPGSAAKVAVRWQGEDGSVRTLTYRELSELTGQVAAGLAGLGVRPGDVVAVYLPMIPEAAAALFGCARLGAIALPIFSGFAADAVAARLNDAGAKVLITADGFLRRGTVVKMKEMADLAADAAPAVERVVVVNRLAREDRPHIPGRDLEWSDVITTGPAPGTWPGPGALSVPSDHPFLLIYTSGTTGRPKGAVLTHAGVLVNTARDAAYHFDMRAEDTLCWVTDMGWIMGPWQLVAAWALGATVVLLEGLPTHPRPDGLWGIMDRHAITTLGVGPSLVRGLASAGAAPAQKHDLDSLRILGATGEPWNSDAWMWLFREVGHERCPIINISGGTEVGGGFLAPLPIVPQVPCALGGPCLGMDMDIVDQEGRSLPAGQVGELVCRKPWPGMTKGIWKDPGRYLDSYWRRWPGVWAHGDWASRDQQGFWFLHGRSDDTLNIAGKRLGPAEVESALGEHPAVWESAAVAVPHEVKGQVIWCFTVLRPGHDPHPALASELQDLVAARLGKAFRPERVLFVADLPRTRSAKIVRRVIRAIAIGEDPGEVFGLEDPATIDAIRDSLPARQRPGAIVHGSPPGQAVFGVKAERARSAASARNMGRQDTDTARAYPETVRKGERE